MSDLPAGTALSAIPVLRVVLLAGRPIRVEPVASQVTSTLLPVGPGGKLASSLSFLLSARGHVLFHASLCAGMNGSNAVIRKNSGVRQRDSPPLLAPVPSVCFAPSSMSCVTNRDTSKAADWNVSSVNVGELWSSSWRTGSERAGGRGRGRG